MLRANPHTLAKRFNDNLGYWPNTENPRTLQEKLLWRKLYEDMTEAIRLADKVAVRDYVREMLGERYLVEALAVADSADEVDFDSLPSGFVLKVNHASGVNVVVRDRSQFDEASAKRVINSLLRLEYGRRYGEHWYSAIRPQVLVERLLIDRDYAMPRDYRFHVFHGRAEFIQIVTAKTLISDANDPTAPKPQAGHSFVDGKSAEHFLYGVDWLPAPFHFRNVDGPAPKLESLPGPAEEMVAIAEKLAGDWGYVRVDLYCIDDRDIYFGEMTFAPASGLFRLVPEDYNDYFGDLWDISKRFVRAR